jgi:two-component system LytT family response regulator
MDKIRTLIVDDEPLARKRIRTFLAKEADFEIVAECENGGRAVEAVEKHEPDLIFLDVQMPDIDGFDVVSALRPDHRPAVVFVTAFDQYAVKAFEVHALDYLLKPFDRDRFRETLARIREVRNEGGAPELQKQLDRLIEDVVSRRRASNRILIKSSGRYIFLNTDEIDWIEAAGNYMRIHVGGEIHLMRETVGGMEERLPFPRFVRIHRSAIINIDRIKELEPTFNGEYAIRLRTGQDLKLSRKYRSRLEEAIGKPL